MIAVDGSARLLDFGVAKAAMAAHVTREGTYKGKLAYSAPEQLRGAATRQSDIYSLAVLLWELLVGERMHRSAKSGAELVSSVLRGTLQTIHEALNAGKAWSFISEADWRNLERLEPIVRKGLSVDIRERWSSAAEMEEALSTAIRPASSASVAGWLKGVGQSFLESRQRIIVAEEVSFRNGQAVSAARSSGPPPQDSFVNLRSSGRSARSVHSDLIVPDIEACYRPNHVLVPASLLLAAVAVTAAVLIWRFGARAPLPAAPTLEAAAQPAVAAADTAESTLEPLAPPPSSAANPAPERPPQALREPSSDGPPRRLADEMRPNPARRPREARREPEPEAAISPAPPVAKPKPATDCTTPYYFEGSKKIFKPACL
jgi:serine/threonine protein kinase